MDLPEPSPAARRAAGATGGWQAMLHRLAGDQAVHLAGLYAQGQRCLTLHHPEVTTADDEDVLLQVLEDIDALGQQVTRARTTTATTWWWETTPVRHADDVVQAARAHLTRLLRPGWVLSEQP